MKLNNKGFAITAVLYGMMILFLLLSVVTLGLLRAQKNNMDKLIDEETGAKCTVEPCGISACNLLVNNGVVSVSLTASSSELASLPYSFDGGITYQENNSKKLECNSSEETCIRKIFVKSASNFVTECGTVDVKMIKKTKFSIEYKYGSTETHYNVSSCSKSCSDSGGSDPIITISDCSPQGYSNYDNYINKYKYRDKDITYVTSCSAYSGCGNATKVTCSGEYKVIVK